MKKIIFSITALLTAQVLVAQVKEGTITYERKINLHKQMADEQMKAMVPEFRTSNYQLLFADNQSMYKAIVEENTPDPFSSSSGGTMVFRMGSDEAENYRNFTTAKFVESRPLGAKTYIIEDSIRSQAWKMTDETKTILNYKCKKATFENPRKELVEAWYTDEIETPVGPENFSGLPGAILEINVNKDEMKYTATNISEKVDKKALQEPKKGKKVTRAEFSKLMEEAFGAPGQGGQRVIMRSM